MIHHSPIFTSICVQGLSDACDWAGLNYEAWDAVADQIGGVAEPRLKTLSFHQMGATWMS